LPRDAPFDAFMRGTQLGRALSAGWHVRLQFLRRWGRVAAFDGHSAIEGSERHAAAMGERRRKDFHFEFTTLRFTCIGEYGAWEGRTSIVPTSAHH
jgi:hypothetical protein